MKRTYLLSSILSLLALLLAACRNGEVKQYDMPDAKRSMYYWRTTFRLDEGEKEFLRKEDIKRLYVRMFDVILDGQQAMPNRTISLKEKMPKGVDIVPVIYIDVDVMGEDRPELARKIVSRISKMMIGNDIAWKELQIDFDWTVRNQDRYFAFLEELRTLLKDEGKGLSTTIRLHQLAMKTPPVDYGALMVYNIGNYADRKETNSILTVKNLKPYLQYLRGYELPLCTALPIFSWNLAFHGDEFMAIARSADVSDTTLFRRMDPRDEKEEYMVVRYHVSDNSSVTDYDGLHLYPGEVIRHEECKADVLMKVRQMIADERSNATDQIILYHLDTENIKNYEYETFENLFGTRR